VQIASGKTGPEHAPMGGRCLLSRSKLPAANGVMTTSKDVT